MTNHAPRRHRLNRLVAPAVLAILAAATLGSATASAGIAPLATKAESGVRGASTATPMVLQNVSLADLVANKGGICNGGFTHVMKSAAGPEQRPELPRCGASAAASR